VVQYRPQEGDKPLLLALLWGRDGAEGRKFVLQVGRQTNQHGH
jgi:hypothetical protein